MTDRKPPPPGVGLNGALTANRAPADLVYVANSDGIGGRSTLGRCPHATPRPAGGDLEWCPRCGAVRFTGVNFNGRPDWELPERAR